MSAAAPRWPRLGLHLWTAWALVAAPLFDALRRHPEFLVAHDIAAGRLALLVAAALVAAPLPWILFARIAGPGAAWPPWLLLPPLLLLGFAGAIGGELGRAALPAGIAFAALGFASYRQSLAVRRYFTWLAPIALVAPALLLAGGLIERLAPVSPSQLQAGGGRPGATTVVVILDELPITTLLDDAGVLDSRRFPNLAALAARAHWFDNVLSVDTSTPKAVSALLTGTELVKGQLPTAHDLPQNLFTLLAPTHEVAAWEPITRLCPPSINRLERPLDRGSEWWMDTAIVALHLILPEPFSLRLPAIDAQWTGFGEPAPEVLGSSGGRRPNWRQLFAEARRATERDRVAAFDSFLATIDGRRRGALYFTHLLLPHRPWLYLPSGATYWQEDYLEPPGFQDKAWPASSTYAAHSYQRHLLQPEFVDRLIGRLVTRLREEEIFDQTLLAITADHGISFLPGEMKRGVTEANRLDVLQVPLLLKLPGQERGVFHAEPRSTLDLLPTLLAALGLELPAELAGRSLLDATEAGVVTPPWREALARREAIFGSLARPGAVHATGPARGWLGKRLGELEAAPETGLRLELVAPGLRFQTQDDEPRVPAWVYGRLRGDLAGRPLGLAIAIDGTIRATTAYEPADEARHFRALLPEEALGGGAHELAVVVLDPETGRAMLPAGGGSAP